MIEQLTKTLEKTLNMSRDLVSTLKGFFLQYYIVLSTKNAMLIIFFVVKLTTPKPIHVNFVQTNKSVS